MAGGLPNLLPLAAATSASLSVALVGIRTKRRAIPLLVSVALALGGALWHLQAQEPGLWFAREHHFRAELVAAGLPPLLVGLGVLLPTQLSRQARSLTTVFLGIATVVGWLFLREVVEGVL